jgi:hypothetical protein
MDAQGGPAAQRAAAYLLDQPGAADRTPASTPSHLRQATGTPPVLRPSPHPARRPNSFAAVSNVQGVVDLLTRPYRNDDAPTLAGLLNLLDLHAGSHGGYTSPEVQTTLVRDLADDTSMLFSPEGDLVAAAVNFSPTLVATGSISWAGSTRDGAARESAGNCSLASSPGPRRFTPFDAESPTGAVGVYERVGFSVEDRAVTYYQPIPAGQLMPPADKAAVSGVQVAEDVLEKGWRLLRRERLDAQAFHRGGVVVHVIRLVEEDRAGELFHVDHVGQVLLEEAHPDVAQNSRPPNETSSPVAGHRG